MVQTKQLNRKKMEKLGLTGAKNFGERTNSFHSTLHSFKGSRSKRRFVSKTLTIEFFSGLQTFNRRVIIRIYRLPCLLFQQSPIHYHPLALLHTLHLDPVNSHGFSCSSFPPTGSIPKLREFHIDHGRNFSQ